MASFSENTRLFNGLDDFVDPSKIILKQSDYDNDRPFLIDRNMLKVFGAVDGKRDLSKIAVETGMSADLIQEVVQRLLAIGLVEMNKAAERKGESLNFLRFVEAHFSIAIGPIASVVIEDEIETMKESRNTFPMDRALELVSLLAKEIPREEKRVVFQQAMIQFFKDMMC